MPAAFVIGIPLITAAVLIASGIAKLRTPDGIDTWRDLGVPQQLLRPLLVRAHPWGEIGVGLAAAVLGGVAGIVATGAATLLMLAYTALILRALRREDDPSCACFGELEPVTRVTAVRNIWLCLLAGASVIAAAQAPLAGGAVRAGIAQWPWLMVLAITAVTVVLVRHRQGSPNAADDGELPGAPVGEVADYWRTRTPAVPVTQADGSLVNLRQLAAFKPILLLAVSPTCGACRPVIQAQPRYAALLPEVDVRLLLTDPPDASPLTQRTEPQSLHDPENYVSGSISDWPTPTAVLLGADGMLAGGPESGSRGIDKFVNDIYESLHGEQPSGDGERPGDDD